MANHVMTIYDKLIILIIEFLKFNFANISYTLLKFLTSQNYFEYFIVINEASKYTRKIFNIDINIPAIS